MVLVIADKAPAALCRRAIRSLEAVVLQAGMGEAQPAKAALRTLGWYDWAQGAGLVAPAIVAGVFRVGRAVLANERSYQIVWIRLLSQAKFRSPEPEGQLRP